MKSMLKTVALASGIALVGAGIYVMNNDKLKRQTARKITKTMDNMECFVNKKMQNK